MAPGGSARFRSATETVDFWLQDGPTPNEGGVVTFSKTLKLCETVDYLQNEIIDIEEELDAIAPSIDHGTWAFDLRDGRLMR